MATRKPVAAVAAPVAAVAAPIADMADAGYRLGKTGDTLRDIAQFVLERDPSYLDEPSDATQTALTAGLRLRYHENNPSKFYTLDWVPCDEGTKAASNKMDVEVAFAVTQQQLGALKTENPKKHALVTEIRKKFGDYKAQNIKRLRVAMLALQSGDAKTKTPADPFNVWLDKLLDNVEKRNKTAKSRDDTTVVDAAKLKRAIQAFKDALK